MKPSTMIGGKSPQHDRNEMDFYSTPEAVTVALLQFLDLPKDTIIWEPACGQGAISKVCEFRGYEVVSTDLNPHAGYGLTNVDFLLVDPPVGVGAIITNPPFDLAPDFIRRAHATTATHIALLTKATFWHAATREPLFHEHPPTYILPLTWRPAFSPERGKSGTMDFIWNVWVKGEQGTAFYPLTRPEGE